MDDGRLNVLTRGTRPFRIVERQDDMPYPAATIEFLADKDEALDARTARKAREAYAELVVEATDNEPDPDELAAKSAYEMAATVDFGLDAKQGLLDLRSENARMRLVTRLFKAALKRLDRLVRALQLALVDQAEQHLDTVMPAFTHLQRAQPISAAHWLLSHAWPLGRDRDRLRSACDRVSVLPLGSGAIAGCPFPVDRVLLQETLGFRHISQNSIDAVGDRDWIAEVLFVAASIGVHLSRLAEDLILFGSAEFGFVRLSDRFSTGSSLMPQKRNPDAMELAR
ncbi:MAG: hypothetical protein KY463_11900, partial [Actinobacteria bacterium]|nr:hypothetical protein [Actinomycetota bacterium]